MVARAASHVDPVPVIADNLPDHLMELYLRLPRDQPFATATARSRGARWEDLRALAAAGFLRHPVKGVYCAAGLEDDLNSRIEALRLVVPEDCVVTDRTAGWLWGAPMILAPGDHLEPPKVSVFAPPGRRLRNELTASGERALSANDVVTIQGMRVTTPLRTACDLGRMLHRDQSLAAIDSLAALRVFTPEELNLEVDRFKGYRGVVQLRAMAPLVDPRVGSPYESVLRLRWYDVGLPRPECQVETPAPHGGVYFLDIGLREQRLAAEYDGEDFHGEEQRDYDDRRREWARTYDAWTIVVARRHNLYGPSRDIERLLIQGEQEAQKQLTRR